MKKLLYIFFAFLCLGTHAQNPTYQQLTTEDGIPSMETYHVMQDSKGYIWISTDHGVVRYNGKKFDHFTTSQNLGDNTIFESFEDEKGRIWFRAMNNVFSYFQNDSIYQPEYCDLSDEFRGDIPQNMAVHLDTLYVFYQRSLIKTSMYDNSVIEIFNLHQNKKYQKLINSKHVVGGYYFVSQKDTGIVDLGEKKITYSLQKDSVYLLKHSGFTQKNIFYNKTIVGIQCNKLSLVDIETGALKLIDVGSKISGLNHDDHYIWACTYDGVYRYSKTNLDGDPVKFLAKKRISHVYRDSEGNTWFSTLNSGVYVSKNIEINNIPNQFDRRSSFIEANDSLLCHINSKSELTIKRKNHVKKIISLNTVKPNCIRLKNNQIFITSDFHFIRLNKNLDTDYKRDSVERAISIGNIYLADNNTTLFGAHKFSVYYLKDNKFISYKDDIKERTTDHIKILNSTIYKSSLEGLVKLNSDNKKLRILGENNELKTRINRLEKFHDTIICATNERGIIFVYNDEIVGQITTKNGLSSDIIREIYVRENVIYACTNSGLNIINFKNPDNYQIGILNKNDGLPSDVVNDVTVFQDSIYVVTDMGISILPKSVQLKNIISPVLYVSSVSSNGKNIQFESPFVLKYDQNNIKIELESLHFKNGHTKNFHYQIISNTDTSDWTSTDNNLINLASLSPADYNINIYSTNEDQIRSEVKTLSFVIQPPIWKTWWFIALEIILLTSVITALVLWRINTIRTKDKLKQEATISRLNALRAQMNPHFLFNALNSINDFILRNKQREASEYLVKFGKLTRLILDSTRSEFILLQDEIDLLKNYVDLQSALLANKIIFDVIFEDEIDPEEIEIPGMIIQPYIENAMIHGFSKDQTDCKLKLSIATDNDHLLCKIEDNGIGIDVAKAKNKNSKKHKSIALSNSKDRLNALQKKFGTDSQLKIYQVTEKGGTIAELKIPFQSLYD